MNKAATEGTRKSFTGSRSAKLRSKTGQCIPERVRNKSTSSKTDLNFSLSEDRVKEVKGNPVGPVRECERLTFHVKAFREPSHTLTCLGQLFIETQFGI